MGGPGGLLTVACYIVTGVTLGECGFRVALKGCVMSGADTFSNGFLIVQAGVLLLTLLALVGSLLFSKRALKAASFVREAQEEAHALYGSMDRQVQNIQMMSDDLRRLSDDVAQRQEELASRLQSPAPAAGDTNSEAPASVEQSFAPEAEEAQAPEDEDKKPGALFRGLLRRR